MVGALQLAGAEARCVLVETEVREEVSREMAGLLRGMEASYQASPLTRSCLAAPGSAPRAEGALTAAPCLYTHKRVLRLGLRVETQRGAHVAYLTMYGDLEGACAGAARSGDAAA